MMLRAVNPGMTGPGEFNDVNDAVQTEWGDETTPYERVRDIMSHQCKPISADAVADTARTSPETAKEHLDTLADDGFISISIGENGATTYRRSSQPLVVEQALNILDTGTYR